MKRIIDCAVLGLAGHDPVLEGLITAIAPEGGVHWHPLALTGAPAAHPHAAPAPMAPASLCLHDADTCLALARAAPLLARFDVAVLFVTPANLGWARVILANAQAVLPIPVLALTSHLKAAALHDLLRLGLTDFQRYPPCPDELRARLLQLAALPSRGPDPSTLAPPRQPFGTTSPPVNDLGTRPAPPDADMALTLHQLQIPATAVVVPYRMARASALTDFERDYVTGLLVRHSGNITHAAQSAGKDRRSFWHLMRKHQIDSAPFRRPRPSLRAQAA